MDDARNALLSKIQASGRLNEITYKFKVLDTDELRIVTILRIMEMFETTPRAKCRTKSTEDSVDLRNRANDIFVSSKNDVDELLKAWQLYSQSISTATKDSPELALAYANRSAVLLKLEKYEECLEDIARALRSSEYPAHLRGKLLCRRIECSRALCRSDLSNDALEEARAWLENTSLSASDRRTFEQKLKNLNNSNGTQLKRTKRKSTPTIVPNRLYPCASEAVTVKTDPRFGRHVVAARDIRPGEILIVEKPYSKILALDEVHTHCSQCLQARWALLPCEFCVHAMYCSDECKKQAWKEYHDVECGVTGYLVDLGFNKHGLFSMRLAIIALRNAGSVASLRESLRDKDDVESYRSDSYANLYNLVTSGEKRSVSDLFERSLNAAFVLYYLRARTSLLGGEKFNGDLGELYADEDATFVGGLILRHMQIIPCNIHSYEEERQMEIVDIGALALPFCSLVNHSCDPNVSRCTTPSRMIVFAIAPIERGSQIYDNYGSHYAVMSKEERRSKLKQYYFDCCCEPCTRNWPDYKSLPTYTDLVKDKKTIRKIEKTLEKLDTYVRWAKEDQIDDKLKMISELARMIETLVGLLPLPCSDVNNAVETLKRVFTLTYGNKFEIPKLQFSAK